MARVPYRHEPGDDVRVATGFATVEEEYGRIGNLFRLLGNAPWVLEPVADLSVAVNRGDVAGIDPATRRLVQLAVSLQNSCDYCVTHNRDWAARAGVTEDKVQALTGGDMSSGVFTEAEAAALAWARTVAANGARRDTEAFRRVTAHFSHPQVVELTVVAAYRTMVNLLQEALWTDLEEPTTSGVGEQRAP